MKYMEIRGEVKEKEKKRKLRSQVESVQCQA
jgi:hypothetical protein